MKTCSSCGHDCEDDAAYCASCGHEFAEPLQGKEQSDGTFRRPPRPEAASIILRTFAQEAPAQLAQATLRAARIEAFIQTDDCGGLLPPLTAGQPFRLVVSEVHRDAAEQVLDEIEKNAPPPTGQGAQLD